MTARAPASFSARCLQLPTHKTCAQTIEHATQGVGCTGEKGPHQKLSFLKRTGCCTNRNGASGSSTTSSSTGRSPRSAKVGSHAKGTVPEANEINFGMQDASWLAQTSFSALARKENMLQIRKICRGEKWCTVLAPFSKRCLQLLTHITYAHTAKHATQGVGCTGEKGPHQKLPFLRRTGCCRSGKSAGPRNGCLAYFDRSSLFQRKMSSASNAPNLCADHRACDSGCGVH